MRRKADERYHFDARVRDCPETTVCLHCGNKILKGRPCVSFRARHPVLKKRVTYWVHFPNCFHEIGGRFVWRDGTRHIMPEPIHKVLGMSDETWEDLKKKVKAWKRANRNR